MAGKSKRRTSTEEERREAVQATLSGESIEAVAKRYKVPIASLYTWRMKYKREGGPLNKLAAKQGKAKSAKSNGDASAMTPEGLFTSRVNLAIALLRQAWKDVKRREREGKIKGPDKAHSQAYLALLELQGDDAL